MNSLSVPEVAAVTLHNARRRPFVWTATADSIFEKLQMHLRWA